MIELKIYNISDILNGQLNLNKLNEEIEASGFIDGFANINYVKTTNDIIIFGNAFNNEVGVNDIIANHIDKTLNEYKIEKYEAIDYRTGELISLGYSYDGNLFSLSSNAQTNILALFSTKDHPAMVYPIEFSTKDDVGNYNAADATVIEAMYLTALATKKAHLDSGTVLKDAVRAATTKQEVDDVIDNR